MVADSASVVVGTSVEVVLISPGRLRYSQISTARLNTISVGRLSDAEVGWLHVGIERIEIRHSVGRIMREGAIALLISRK
jgi:hypothetical protein